MKRNADNSKQKNSKKMCQTADFCSKKTVGNGIWRLGESLLVYTPSDIIHQPKVLALDMDSTIILTASGKVFAKDMNDWKLFSAKVAPTLKSYYNKDFKIVIMTNQSTLKDESKIAPMQKKIENIISEIGIPIQAFVSIKNDINRKPRTGFWQALEMSNDGIEIIKKDSIYCGDAAGRSALGKIKKDHSHADRLFALNVGVPFKTPEELWDNEPCTRDLYELSFDPKKLLKTTHSKLHKFSASNKQEMLLMVGLPASGKSTFVNEHLAKLNYSIISRDILDSVPKCISQAKQLLGQGKSVVIDNTNLDIESRSKFLVLAKPLSVPVRALVMEVTFDNAQHNEMFRQLSNSKHDKINSMVFHMMKKKYVEPTLGEGFVEVLKIPFLPNPPDHLRDLYFQYLLEK